MNYISITTTEGARWDTIAYRAYGDPLQVNRLYEANPNVAIYPTIPAGTELNVPIVEEVEATEADLNNLPPWKR